MKSQYKIGHAHIKVRDLDKSIEFYQDILDFKVTEKVGDYFAFLSGGDMHHELALQAVGENAPEPLRHGTGLYHIAYEAESEDSLLTLVEKLKNRHVRYAAVDHGISHAIYFDDPSGNGVEVYLDTRKQNGNAPWAGKSEPLTIGN